MCLSFVILLVAAFHRYQQEFGRLTQAASDLQDKAAALEGLEASFEREQEKAERFGGQVGHRFQSVVFPDSVLVISTLCAPSPVCPWSFPVQVLLSAAIHPLPRSYLFKSGSPSRTSSLLAYSRSYYVLCWCLCVAVIAADRHTPNKRKFVPPYDSRSGISN